jgi:hypothetical protein
METLQPLIDLASRNGLQYSTDDSIAEYLDVYVYSPDMLYRYAFARSWAQAGRFVLWVGVNPAKGDTEKRRRPTLERCIRWSKEWGASGLLIGNLFAVRHNTPDGLRASANPVGPHNDEALATLSRVAWRTVVAWGNDGRRGGRAEQVAALLNQPECFGLTAAGEPRHPLYVPHDSRPQHWEPARRRTRG